MKIQFTVPGEPQGKGRPRFTGQGRAYTPEKTKAYESLVKAAFLASGCKAFPPGVPLVIHIDAYYAIPKSASKQKQAQMQNREIRPTKTPDYDNVAKAVSDSLNGLAYHDDAQIVDGRVRKFYDYLPRVEVLITQEDTQ